MLIKVIIPEALVSEEGVWPGGWDPYLSLNITHQAAPENKIKAKTDERTMIAMMPAFCFALCLLMSAARGCAGFPLLPIPMPPSGAAGGDGGNPENKFWIKIL